MQRKMKNKIMLLHSKINVYGVTFSGVVDLKFQT